MAAKRPSSWRRPHNSWREEGGWRRHAPCNAATVLTRSGQFVVTCIVFHVGTLALSVYSARAWLARRARRTVDRVRTLVLGAASLLLAIAAWAALCSLLGTRSGFTVLRLVSQALFSEMLLLSVLVATREFRSSPKRALAFAAIPLGLLGTYWEAYHREPTALEVRTHELDLSGRVPLGRLRLLHLSDLQCDQIGPYEARVIEEARRLKPDLVVWTGDYVQPRLKPSRAETEARFREILGRRPTQATLGSYAVRGDVDVNWPHVVAGTEIVALSGRSIRLELPGGRALRLIGLHPGTSRGHDVLELARMLGAANDAELTFVVGHNPAFVRQLPGLGRVDLALAGHTHGGQVVIPFFGAPYTKSPLPRRYASGLNEFAGIPIHVSAGIGMERGSAPQVRFFCPPEICLLEIRY